MSLKSLLSNNDTISSTPTGPLSSGRVVRVTKCAYFFDTSSLQDILDKLDASDIVYIKHFDQRFGEAIGFIVYIQEVKRIPYKQYDAQLEIVPEQSQVEPTLFPEGVTDGQAQR